MGSGLILLVIVGAWLAVLVPMALKSHDTATSLRSADRFSDAMRVLSRRQASRRETVLVAPPRPVEPMLKAERLDERPPLTLAQRRRRVLLSLLGGAVVGLLGSLLVGRLLVPGLLLLVLAVAYVVVLRRQELARQAERRAARESAPRPDSGLDILDRPARRAPAAAPAARSEDPLPLAAGAEASWGTPAGWAEDGGWSPVPVPVPTYVTAPVAPPRAPRVLDLTEPERWAAEEQARTHAAGPYGDADDLELDDILERRKAVGGW